MTLAGVMLLIFFLLKNVHLCCLHDVKYDGHPVKVEQGNERERGKKNREREAAGMCGFICQRKAGAECGWP